MMEVCIDWTGRLDLTGSQCARGQMQPSTQLCVYRCQIRYVQNIISVVYTHISIKYRDALGAKSSRSRQC